MFINFLVKFVLFRVAERVFDVTKATIIGSSGLGTVILGANLITDLVLARPLCIERSLFYELHPARFLIRKLKKGLKI